MRLFNSQIHWRGLGTIVVVELLVLLAILVAVVSYVQWSSDSAVAEFANAEPLAASSASDLNSTEDSSVQPHNGRTGCPRGKRSLPTQLVPLP